MFPTLVVLSLAYAGLVEGRRVTSRLTKNTLSGSSLIVDAAKTSEDLHKIADAFALLAGESNFALKKGIFHNFDLNDCNDLTDNGLTCYAENPGSPYGLIMVPAPEGAHEDYSECGGKWKPICKTNADGETVSIPWHMNSTEAIVLIGMTPPEVRYFSFQNYLFEHTYPPDFEIDDDKVLLTNRCWPSGSSDRRCESFASVGDSLNKERMITFSADAESRAQNDTRVFGKPFALVMSPSKAVFHDVESMLKDAGITNVNELPLPGQYLKLGFEQGTDTVMNLLRTALPSDNDAYAKWMAYAESSFIVQRLTPRKSISKPDLYPKPEYCQEGKSPPKDYCIKPRSKVSEGERKGISMESLEEAQEQIISKVKSRVGFFESLHSSEFTFSSGVQDSGFHCVELGQKCQGDSRDTYYPASADLIMSHLGRGAVWSAVRQKFGKSGLSIEDMAKWRPILKNKRSTLQDFDLDAMVVVGVLHSALNASAYSSVSVYDFFKLQGTLTIEDTQMVGSANEFLKGTKYEDLSPYLFAWEFTREDCGDNQFCTTVTSDGDLGIPLTTPILFIERMYNDPQTNVGIDPSAVIPAKVVHIAKKM